MSDIYGRIHVDQELIVIFDNLTPTEANYAMVLLIVALLILCVIADSQ